MTMSRAATIQEIETRRGVGLLGAILAFVFTALTAYFNWDDFSYWAILTGLAAVLGWSLLLLAFIKEATWFGVTGRLSLTAIWLGEPLTAEGLHAQFRSQMERIWTPDRFPEMVGSTDLQADEDDQSITLKMEGLVSDAHAVRMLQALDQELDEGWRIIDAGEPTRAAGHAPDVRYQRKTRIRLVWLGQQISKQNLTTKAVRTALGIVFLLRAKGGQADVDLHASASAAKQSATLVMRSNFSDGEFDQFEAMLRKRTEGKWRIVVEDVPWWQIWR